ncbi:MAG: thioesterase family protein [Chitinophagales bacterium]
MPENKITYKHITPVQLRFADMDSLGHINNANYLTYVELARCNYLNEVLNIPVDFSDLSVILAKAELEFLRPAKFGDQLTIGCACSRIGRKSFELIYEIFQNNSKQEISVLKAKTILVAFNYPENKTVEIPKKWRDALNDFEKHLIAQ